MNNDIEEHLSKSRTTYRNLHQPISPSQMTSTKIKTLPSEDSDDESTLPTFVNRFFSPKTTLTHPSTFNETGMFRAIRGQVIIHHDDDRSSKVQCEDDDDDDEEEVEEELQNLPIYRPNTGNYELHYDVDNPLEISCSMSLSSAETVSDHSPSPARHTSSINIDGNNPRINCGRTPIDSSSSDDETPSSISSDTGDQEKKVIDHDDIKEQDEKLRTFRGWHLSMLKQIDEKLREIELETNGNAKAISTAITSMNSTRKFVEKSSMNKKKFLRPTNRRRFDGTNLKRQNSPIAPVKIPPQRSRTPSVEKESRTLIINLPPSSSSSSASSDNEQDFPLPPPAPSESIHVRIVHSPIYQPAQQQQRSHSTDRLILRDQGAQTEPLNPLNSPIDHRLVRPASADSNRILPTRSLTRVQGKYFLQQQQQQQQQQPQQQLQPIARPTDQIKFYSLRSRNVQSRPSLVTQSPKPFGPIPTIPSVIPKQPIIPEKKTSFIPSNSLPMKSADPSVYSDDYGHVTQMDTTNLGSLVDKVFDDIYQDKPSDFYRDYRQLLNDIQIRFSMVSSVDQSPLNHRAPAPPPPPSFAHRPPPPPASVFVDYSRLAPQPAPPSSSQSTQAHLLDTLIYIPNSR